MFIIPKTEKCKIDVHYIYIYMSRTGHMISND